MGKQNATMLAAVSPQAAKTPGRCPPSAAKERKDSAAYSLFQFLFYVFDSDGKQLDRRGRLHLGLCLHGHQITKAVIVVTHDVPDVPAGSAANNQRQHDAGKHG